MDICPKVSLIKTVEEYNATLAAASADGHNINWPSHVVKRDGQIVGAASVGNIPFLALWHDSKKVKIRDSSMLQVVYHALLEKQGAQGYLIACDKNSPYNPFMKAAGYKPLWETELFYQPL